MKCIKCGAHIIDGDMFCGECGTKVEEILEELNEKQEVVVEAPATNNKKIFAIIGIFLVLAVAIVFFISGNGASSAIKIY